jgi:hypothetical protein
MSGVVLTPVTTLTSLGVGGSTAKDAVLRITEGYPPAGTIWPARETSERLPRVTVVGLIWSPEIETACAV